MIGKKHFCIVFTLILAITGTATADLHYFTQDSTLYSTNNGGALNSVAISSGGTFVGLAFDPSGDLWGSNSANKTFYKIDRTTGVATSQFSYSGASIISFDFRTVAGTLQLFGMGGDTAKVFNATTGAGISTNDNFPGVNGGGFPSTAFDGSTYYGSRSDNNSLYELEVDSGSATLIAPISLTSGGSPITWSLAGGAWYGGEYLSGFRNGSTIHFGDINTSTGVFSSDFNFGGFGNASAMGYAVVPAPGAFLLGLIGLSACGFVRRRAS